MQWSKECHIQSPFQSIFDYTDQVSVLGEKQTTSRMMEITYPWICECSVKFVNCAFEFCFVGELFACYFNTKRVGAGGDRSVQFFFRKVLK